MQVIERLGCDGADALLTAGHGDADRAVRVQAAHQVFVHLPVRAVLDHADLLGDDAPLLLHRLLGEVGHADEAQQRFQVFREMLGAVKIVRRHGVGGKGVGLGAPLCQLLQHVPRFRVEHLVLQIMGDAGRGLRPAPAPAELHVHAAVAGGKHRVFAAKARFFHHVHRQAVGQGAAGQLFLQARIARRFHQQGSFRPRK